MFGQPKVMTNLIPGLAKNFVTAENEQKKCMFN